MTRSRLLLLVLPLLAGCANAVYRLEGGAMFARANGDVALQGSAGAFDSAAKNDVDSDLGLGGTSASAFGRLQADAEKNRFRVQGFALNEGGDGTLAEPYGDIPAGEQVSTSLQFFGLAGNWTYAVVRTENLRLGAGAQAGFYRFDVDARTASNDESTSVDALVPMPMAEAEFKFGNVSFGANMAGMYADVGDAKGRFLDGEAFARWSLSSEFQVFGGYRWIVFDAAGKASDREFDAEEEAVDGDVGVRF